MNRTHLMTAAAVAAAAATLTGVSAGRQTTGPTTPPLVIASMAGNDLYQAYCASCHGARARVMARPSRR